MCFCFWIYLDGKEEEEEEEEGVFGREGQGRDGWIFVLATITYAAWFWGIVSVLEKMGSGVEYKRCWVDFCVCFLYSKRRVPVNV